MNDVKIMASGTCKNEIIQYVVPQTLILIIPYMTRVFGHTSLSAFSSLFGIIHFNILESAYVKNILSFPMGIGCKLDKDASKP